MADANTTTRRALLKAAPALALVGAGTAEAQAETAVMALFRRHQELTRIARAYPMSDATTDEELDRLFYNELGAIEDQMALVPAVTAQDMAAKMVAVHGYGDHTNLRYDTDPVWIEARALIGA